MAEKFWCWARELETLPPNSVVGAGADGLPVALTLGANLSIANGVISGTGGGGGPAIAVDGIYLSMSATNPATALGYGTWSLISSGRMLVGVDAGDPDFDTAGDTGGAKTHALTSAEMPAHTHVQDAHNHTQSPHSHGMAEGTTDGSGTFMDRSSAAVATTANTDAATATNQAATATNQSTGGGGAHNNMPPFFAVYMFRRTA